MWVGVGVGIVLAFVTWPGNKNWYFGKHLSAAVGLFMVVGIVIGKLIEIVIG
jgi:hypothetical protein